MTKRDKVFRGPLFVVGMSRSGTTLLREVLNRHPEVGIPSAESLFIPYIIQRYRHKTFPLDQKYALEIRSIVKESRFYDMLLMEGVVIEDSLLEKILKSPSLAEIIESLMRFYADSDNDKSDFIWGDKSPTYLLNILLLKDFFPDARFIHIIRDPRDRALSASKAWGANLYFTSERWCKSIKAGRQQGRQMGDDYLEIFYEKLITAPDIEIKRLCEFLDISYNKSMLKLKKPFEQHGAMDRETRHTTRIVPDNTDKYLRELNPDQVKRIDEIVFPVANALGYSPMYKDTRHVPLNKLQKMICSFTDRLNAFAHHIRKYGFQRGLRFMHCRSKTAISDKLSDSR